MNESWDNIKIASGRKLSYHLVT